MKAPKEEVEDTLLQGKPLSVLACHGDDGLYNRLIEIIDV
jgi:hypothetical protein